MQMDNPTRTYSSARLPPPPNSIFPCFALGTDLKIPRKPPFPVFSGFPTESSLTFDSCSGLPHPYSIKHLELTSVQVPLQTAQFLLIPPDLLLQSASVPSEQLDLLFLGEGVLSRGSEGALGVLGGGTEEEKALFEGVGTAAGQTVGNGGPVGAEFGVEGH